MAIPLWQLAFVVFPAIAILHLQVSPFTKVEESFNIQAIHDILEYGVPTSDAAQKFRTLFDHMTFPGAVPRTFIGSLVLSGLAKPEIWIGDLVGKASQTHVRAVLGGMNATALAIFARQVERGFGPITATWYVVLQASQFHLWYYASRTLPNMFAFFFSTVGLAFLLPNPTSSLGPVKRTRLGLYLITIATVIFRSELAILLVAHCVWFFLKPQTLDAKILLVRKTFIPSMIPGALLALLLTVSIDTYFWQSSTYLWPELSAFLSNVFPSKDKLGASAWGTQPFYWYLAVALPRLLMNQIFMVDLFFAFPQTLLDTRILDSLIPSYAYVILYSILPHKETRFMFPIVPSLTLVAAMTCTRLTVNMHKSIVTKLLFYAAIVSTVITAFISHAALLPLSAQNYPGGQALQALHEYYHKNYHTITPLHNDDPSHPQIHVHLTNLALQSGVTRFLEQPPEQNNSIHVTPDLYVRPVVKGSHNQDQNQNDARDPIILPGDANHPALTIHPKPATPSSTLSDNRAYQNPTWTYDKSPTPTSAPANTSTTNTTFFTPFDFLIVEDPSQLPLQGPWHTITHIKSLSPPQLLRPTTAAERRYNPFSMYATTLPELLDYWTHFTLGDNLRNTITDPSNDGDGKGTTRLLRSMYPEVIAVPLTRLHDLLHDRLRLDWGVTRGYWVDFGLVTKLYVLRNCAAGGVGCEDAWVYSLPEVASDHPHGHGEDSSLLKGGIAAGDAMGQDGKGGKSVRDTASDDASPLIDAAAGNPDRQATVSDWDTLGPLVINKDGTLSRLDNWVDMNAQERKRTVEYLRKRNMIRMERAV